MPLACPQAPDFGLYTPPDADAVLQAMTPEELADPDERLPYFAKLWPAGVVLARLLLEGPGLSGVRALDLGCGLGPAGLAAAQRGAHVTFVDWEARALQRVRRSAARLQHPTPDCARLSFQEVAAGALGPPGLFDLILGSDVLYESRMLEPVVAVLVRCLAPQGTAHLGDPFRRSAAGFPDEARSAGLVVGKALERRLDSESGLIRIWPVTRPL